MVKRLKHLSINDLAYSFYFKESFDFLDSVDFNCLSAKDLTKLYCVAKYENDLELLSKQAKQIVINHEEKIKKSRKKLVEYFGYLSDAQFLLDVKEIKNEEGALVHDYIDALEDNLVSIKIKTESILFVLNNHIIPLYVLLYQKKLSQHFKATLKEYMMAAHETIELFVSEYDENHDFSSRRKYNIPDVFTNEDIDKIILNYLEYEYANYNILKCLVYHKNSKDTYFISPSTRTRIKKVFKKQQDDLMNNHSVQISDFELRIDPSQEESKIYRQEGGHTLISYSGKWINENLDNKATILNNLIYIFEQVDNNFRFGSLPTKSAHSIFNDLFEGKNKNEYGTLTFQNIDGVMQTSFFAYYEYLKKKGTLLENVYEWFSDDYIKNEFGVDGFEISLPTENLSNVLKCKNLFSEIEKILKSFMVYQKYGSIEADIYEEESLCKYHQLKSLNGEKYIYPNDTSDVGTILFLLFSDQSMLNYLNDEKHASSFVELIEKHKPSYNDFQNYHKNKIDFLIEKNVIKKNKNGTISYTNIWVVGILKELFSKGFLDVHHFSNKYQDALKWLDTTDWIVKSDTLFSKQESDYLNFYLNNSVFTNALALRNKYEHPSILNQQDDEVFKDYVMGLKILGLIIIKINDELCIKNPEKESMPNKLLEQQ